MSPRSFGDRSNTAPLNQVTSITKPQDVQCLPEEPTAQSPSGDTDRTLTGRIKRRAAKPRRKWSEEETNHLLLGVSKHGVGRWTDILEDREFKFEDRTAGDLKDRFRTCCPAELCNASKGGDGLEPAVHKNDKRPKKGLMSENILNDTDEEAEIEKSAWMQNDSDLAPKQRKSRAHRKRLEDLAELGIRGPFKKSQRRERRPFSEQDDREILLGYEKYGPHWTKIQRDPSFNLSSRQPTDLRDRLRNKYPEKFVGTEKTAMQIRDTRANNLLEPSITMAIKNSLNMPKSSLLEPQLNRSGSREDMPKWPLPSGLPEIGDPVPFQQNMPWSTDVGAGFPSGEMDISRLLLDDNQVIGEPLPTDRRGFG
ncbi:hypothetical protein GGS20DRAFT_543715 [Poronia punctata]|nr:hypothetical protein GGS20DRAFT_543715 [Poronia punctata]